MNQYDLGGHSGCRIYLIEEDDGSVFVRKISKDRNYNERLRVQSEKQRSFASGAILTPAVLNHGETDDGCYFFDMEYIQGITLSEYIKTMEISKVKGLVQSLVKSLVPQKDCSLPNLEAREIFAKKISGLRKTLSCKNNAIIDCSLTLLEQHDWSALTPSRCHGDMTLENIIIKNDKLYFIDFLDSFYDSWFLDIGTLLQDVQVMWSYRYQKDVSMNTILRLMVFRDLLLDEIRAINPDYVLEVYYSLLQKLIRIYPYTKDELTYTFLNEKTTLVLENIRKFESVDREEGICIH